MNDERLEKLGTYFVYFDLYNTLGITFEQFVEKVKKGTWKLFENHHDNHLHDAVRLGGR